MRAAASRLKEEALRRYKRQHRESLDRHERELTEEFFINRHGRVSTTPTSPDIDESIEDESENKSEIHSESAAESVSLKIGDSRPGSNVEATCKIKPSKEPKVAKKRPSNKSKEKGKNQSKPKGKAQSKSKPKLKPDKKPKGNF